MPQDPAPKNRKRWTDQEEALLVELGVEGFLSSPGCSRDPEAVKQRAWLIERRKKNPGQSLVLPDGEDPGNRRNRASEAPGAKIVRDWIEMIVGDDPSREGLQGTPERVLRAARELFGGYERKPEDLFTCFAEGACQEMVCLRDIEFYSTCEHHLLPFFGRVHVAYLPGGKVIGISKLARLVEIYSRRLQIQERLSAQIADALMNHGGALGSMVIIEAQHLCMTSRGIQKQNSVMSTSAIRGRFKESDIARSEALALLLGGRGREIL